MDGAFVGLLALTVIVMAIMLVVLTIDALIRGGLPMPSTPTLWVIGTTAIAFMLVNIIARSMR